MSTGSTGDLAVECAHRTRQRGARQGDASPAGTAVIRQLPTQQSATPLPVSMMRTPAVTVAAPAFVSMLLG